MAAYPPIANLPWYEAIPDAFFADLYFFFAENAQYSGLLYVFGIFIIWLCMIGAASAMALLISTMLYFTYRMLHYLSPSYRTSVHVGLMVEGDDGEVRMGVVFSIPREWR